MRNLLPMLVAVLCLSTPVHAQPERVVLVRHAEKSAEPKDDPALSSAGQQRAQALADALEHAQVRSIITTQFRRTRETAAPLAERLHITPQVVAASKGDAHVLEVVAAVRAQQGTVLVVGHSNTVARIAHALGAPAMADLCETTFGLALVLTPAEADAPLLRLRYGAADAAPQAGCQ